jgi:hypothetical protein
MNGWMQRIEAVTPKSVLACIFALTAFVAIYFPVVAWVAASRFGADAIYATLTAAGVCWFASVLSLVVMAGFQDPQRRIVGILGGMLIRMLLPLAVGVSLHRAGGQLASNGVFGQIVAFYLFTLVIETWLSFSAVGLMGAPVSLASASDNAD